MVKKLYDETLKYNCSYYEMKSEIYSNLLIVFLGTNEFIITNNFLGVVALGRRSYDFDKQQAIYKWQPMSENIHFSRVEKLIRTYEAQRLKIHNISIERVKEIEG